VSTTEIPLAWAELVECLTVLAKGHTDDISPLWCEHDTLHVCADPEKFTPEELERLETLGFHVDDEDGFYSFRFGSA
jgi:hypothetical protein